MTLSRRHVCALGLTLIQLLAVTGVISILMSLGTSVALSARRTARVIEAENNLRQVSTALELYFRKYNVYPSDGCNLAAELTPFVSNPDVFRNPLLDETTPGQTLSEMYQQPSLQEADRPDKYVTAFYGNDGQTVVVLKTGTKIEEVQGVQFTPGDSQGLIATLTASETAPPPTPAQPQVVLPPFQLRPSEPSSESTPTTPPASTQEPAIDPGVQIGGRINLNPRNNDDFEFELRYTTPNGTTTITRDGLHASNGDLKYAGDAVWIRFNPKGNGNQNELLIDGVSTSVQNGRVYVIEQIADDEHSGMTVNLYNDKADKNGTAMGRWWIEIDSSNCKFTQIK